MTQFEMVFHLVIGEEGGLTVDPADPGNWTGGSCGRGLCKGTKYGISASSHPTLDIADLTLDQAHTIYRDDYWAKLAGDALPKALSTLVFDAAVNCGIKRAVTWLQMAAGCKTDGILGRETLSAIEAANGKVMALCAEFQAQRLMWMCSLPTWHIFGLGWARRICSLPYLSATAGDI